MTSYWRWCNVASTSVRHYFDAMCPLGHCLPSSLWVPSHDDMTFFTGDNISVYIGRSPRERKKKRDDRREKKYANNSGAPVAHWLKRWPNDLAVPGSSLPPGELFSNVNWIPLHIAFHYHPPIVLIWLKYHRKGRKIASHPAFIQPKQLPSAPTASTVGPCPAIIQINRTYSQLNEIISVLRVHH